MTGESPNYPRLVVESLIYARSRGESFATAWYEAMLAFPPRDYGFGSKTTQRPGGVEPPLVFFKRHCRAAWDNAEAERYCACEDCPRLAMFGAYCDDHQGLAIAC